MSCDVADVRTPTGDVVQRQVIRHPGAVAVVAICNGKVVFIRQYRAALDTEMLEIPAGKLDQPGEPPIEAAKRELIEETGLYSESLVELGSFHTAAGFCDEKITIFAALDPREGDRDTDGTEEAYSQLITVPVKEVEDWLVDGRITDAKTIIGLGWAAARGLLTPAR